MGRSALLSLALYDLPPRPQSAATAPDRGAVKPRHPHFTPLFVSDLLLHAYTITGQPSYLRLENSLRVQRSGCWHESWLCLWIGLTRDLHMQFIPAASAIIRGSAWLTALVAIAVANDLPLTWPVLVFWGGKGVRTLIERLFGPVRVRTLKLASRNRRRRTSTRLLNRVSAWMRRIEYQSDLNLGRRAADHYLGFQFILLGHLVIEWTWSNVPVIRN
jgi:hypothetical protein